MQWCRRPSNRMHDNPLVDPECRINETDQSVKPEDAKNTEYVMHMRYQLPEALVCTRCILQMVYGE